MISLSGDERVLVILKGAIGDVARGIFVATELKKRYPKICISWLIEQKSKDVVECVPAIDKIFIFDRRRGIAAFFRTVRDIRHFKPDITLDMQRHFKSGLFSWLSNAPIRVGFNRRNAKELNWLFQTTWTEFTPDSEPKIEAYKKFLSTFGIEKSSVDLDFGLSPSNMPVELEPLFASPNKKIGIVLGSTWETKNWPTEGYIRLISELIKISDLEVFLLGDLSQRHIAEEILSRVPSKFLNNLAGKTKLSGLISILPKFSLLVGPDSGPGHIGAAIGVKQVTLFGPTQEDRVAPHGGRSLVVRAPVSCAPCLRKKCPGLNNICMRLISADNVLKKIRQALCV